MSIKFLFLNKSLNFFYPDSNRPLREICKLKRKKDNVFVIQTGGNFDYIGEDFVFEFDKSKNLKKVKIGPNTLTPFNDFINKKK